MQEPNTENKTMHFNTYIQLFFFFFKPLPLSYSWFEYLYLKTIILWMYKTIAFTRWCDTVKQLAFPGLVFSLQIFPWGKRKKRCLFFFPYCFQMFKWQRLWPGYLKLQKLQVICTSALRWIIINTIDLVSKGLMLHFEFCIWCPDRAFWPEQVIHRPQQNCIRSEKKIIIQREIVFFQVIFESH